MMKGLKLLMLGILVVAMAVPSFASQITLIKETTATDPPVYYLGETINYECTVANPPGNLQTNTVTDVWDTLPNGSIVWFVQSGVDPPLIQAPGDSNTFYTSYVVNIADLVYLPPPIDHNGVANLLNTLGYDTLGDPLNAGTGKNSEVIQPDTEVTIVSSAAVVVVGGNVNLTVTETNTGDDPLTDPCVVVNDGISDIFTVVAPPDDGDTDSNSVLDVGETWSWTRTSGAITATTTFTATGHGTDKRGNDVTYPGHPDEQDQVTVETRPPPCIKVTKDVNCTISKAGDTVTYEICIENCGDTNIVTIVSMTDTVLDDATIKALMEAAIGDSLKPEDACCIYVDYVIPDPEPSDPLQNTVTVEVLDEFEQADSNQSNMVSVDIVHPSFTVTKDCRQESIPLILPAMAIFDINIVNTGDVCLHFDMNELGDPCVFDLPADGVKQWETHILIDTQEEVENQLLGKVTLLPGVDGQCGDPCECLTNEYDVNVVAVCEVGGATRTPGF
jgi:uncharacterized repeat protein (TIGR01451 family)